MSGYMSEKEMQQFDKLLEDVIGCTFSCWTATRINGASASLACDGNVSIPLLRGLDDLFNENLNTTKAHNEIIGVLKGLLRAYIPVTIFLIIAHIISTEVWL